MKNYCLIFILTIGFFNFFQAQDPVSELSRNTHLKQLKAGILFVQMPNSNKKIKKLKELKRFKAAQKEEKEITEIRVNILKGFDNHFDFCEFVFFETKHIKEILNGNYENVFNSKKEKIEDLSDVRYSYLIRNGERNPAGEVYKYNGRGFQIKHIVDGKMIGIKSDIFYAGFVPNKILRKIKNRTQFLISKINGKLYSVRIKSN